MAGPARCEAFWEDRPARRGRPTPSRPQPFDAAGHLSDNRASMKQLALVFAAAAAFAAAGCEKSSDLAPVTAEAKGIFDNYKLGLTELEQRVQEIGRRRGAVALGEVQPAVERHLTELTTNLLPAMHKNLSEAQAELARATADTKLDEPQRVAAIRTASYRYHDRLAKDWIRINAKLDAVDALVSRAEQRAQAPTPAPDRPDAQHPDGYAAPRRARSLRGGRRHVPGRRSPRPGRRQRRRCEVSGASRRPRDAVASIVALGAPSAMLAPCESRPSRRSSCAAAVTTIPSGSGRSSARASRSSASSRPAARW